MKRILCFTLILILILLLTACGGPSWIYWPDEGFGWIEVTDATGIYTELKGAREDSGVLIDLNYQRLGDGSMEFYDANHVEEPFFTLEGTFEKKKAKISGGVLDGKTLTTATVELLSDRAIDLPGGVWLEGKIGHADGTLTIRGFFFKWRTADTWEALKENRNGKLKLGREELLPENYEVLENYMSWNWNFYPALYFPMAEPVFENAVQLHMAADYPADQQTRLLRLDNEKGFTQVVLEISRAVMDIQFVALQPDGSKKTLHVAGDWGLYHYRDGALVVQMTFGNDTPPYGIRLLDYHRHLYTYGFVFDEATGTVTLEELEPVGKEARL